LFPPHNPKNVISTEGGAFAAAAEKSAVAVACSLRITPNTSFRQKAAHLPPQWRNLLLPLPHLNHYGSGSGSTILIPGRIVDVALNFR
jgi:hypothetical protein